MKARSISHRNVVGAFVGGVLGILMLGYVHPVGLPIGCLFGIIIGFRYDLILDETKEQYLRSLVRLHRMKRVFKMPRWLFKQRQFPKMTRPRFVTRIMNAIGYGILWFITRPRRFGRWFKHHEVNRMLTLEAVTLGVMNISLLLVVAGLIWQYIPQKEDLTVLVLLGFVMWALMTIMIQTMLLSDINSGSLSRKYRRYEKYSHCGVLLHSLATAGQTLFIHVAALYVTAIGILGLFVGIFCFIFGLLLTGALQGLIVSIYKATFSKGYYVCFAITLAVTTISGGLLYTFLENHLVIWLVALANGTLCGLVVEPIRKIAQQFFLTNNTVSSLVIKSFEETIDVFQRIFKRLGTPFIEVWIYPVDRIIVRL